MKTEEKSESEMTEGGFALARKTIPFLSPFRVAILSIVVFTVVLSSMEALEPLLMKALFDSLGRENPFRQFGMAAVGLVALGFAHQGMSAFLNWLTWKTRVSVQYNIQKAVVDRLFSLPLLFFRRRSVGGIVSR